MADVAHNVEQEFWRPPAVTGPVAPMPKAASAMVDVCEGCGSEFMMGARFCHICGTSRATQAELSSARNWASQLEFQSIKDRIGLSTGSLIAFIIGIGCVLLAIAVGFYFTAQTVLDWQAVQIWRIQWLLASVAAFIAGILLKKSAK
jgi:hypothetical protein